jgi:hypothetical protein
VGAFHGGSREILMADVDKPLAGITVVELGHRGRERLIPQIEAAGVATRCFSQSIKSRSIRKPVRST